MPLDPRLLTVALDLAPEVITLIKAAFVTRHPDAPALTDAAVIAGLQTAFVSSLAKDDNWLAAHPSQ